MIALLVILTILVLFLALPSGLFVASEQGRLRARVIIAGIHIPIPAKRILQKTVERAEVEEDSGSEWPHLFHSAYKNLTDLLGVIASDIASKLWRTGVRLFKLIKIRIHRLFLIIATPDPAWTGALYGAAYASAPMIRTWLPFEFAADFTKHKPRLDFAASLTLIPARALYETLKAFISLRGSWKLIQRKLKNKGTRHG